MQVRHHPQHCPHIFLFTLLVSWYLWSGERGQVAAVDAHCKVQGALRQQPLQDVGLNHGQRGCAAHPPDQDLVEVRVPGVLPDACSTTQLR